MIKQSDIRKFQARYHRNGVRGEGFYLCSFLWRDGRKFVPLRAVLFEDKYAVFGEDIGDRYRGDDFEQALRDALKVMEESQKGLIYAD